MALTTDDNKREPVTVEMRANKSYKGREIGPDYGEVIVEVDWIWARRWLHNGDAVLHQPDKPAAAVVKPDGDDESDGYEAEAEGEATEATDSQADAAPVAIPEDFPFADILAKNGVETLEALRAIDDLTTLDEIGDGRAAKIEAALAGLDG